MGQQQRIRDEQGRRVKCVAHASSAVAVVRMVRRRADGSITQLFDQLCCARCMCKFYHAWGRLPSSSISLFGSHTSRVHLKSLEALFVVELKARGVFVRDSLSDIRKQRDAARRRLRDAASCATEVGVGGRTQTSDP